ncbi:2-amino-4-hydroxy-6-hydroxymethyldihydropteridinediphosphokinase [Azospirillaceae bacterium]
MKIPVYLALGSNLGDRFLHLRRAIKELFREVAIDTMSRVYETDAMYVSEQPKFLNMVVRGKTLFRPDDLLIFVKELEFFLGREHNYRYGPRVIDIDILFYGDQIVNLPYLEIPHPRIFEREFVLRPLLDIAQNLNHPKLNLSIREMFCSLPKESTIEVFRG